MSKNTAVARGGQKGPNPKLKNETSANHPTISKNQSQSKFQNSDEIPWDRDFSADPGSGNHELLTVSLWVQIFTGIDQGSVRDMSLISTS